MIQINKTLTVILAIIGIFTAFFMLFVFPVISGEYRENNMLTTILMFCLLILSIEKLIQLIFNNQIEDAQYEIKRRKTDN